MKLLNERKKKREKEKEARITIHQTIWWFCFFGHLSPLPPAAAERGRGNGPTPASFTGYPSNGSPSKSIDSWTAIRSSLS